MNDDQDAQALAQAEKDKAILVLGVVRVVDQQGAFVREHGAGVVERDAVLAEVGLRRLRIPLEPDA